MAEKSSELKNAIELRGVKQHNLKNLDVDIPLRKLTVVTGPSGSGKSSLAFHTLYAEGQRRYVETFSPYVRQFFDRMDKPNVDRIDGIPPAIAIEQKNGVRTTRSTVGTITEINDYLKLLFPRIAKGYDPETGEEVRPDTPETVANYCQTELAGEQILVTFPIPVPDETAVEDFFLFLQSQGYLRVLIYGEIHRVDEPETVKKKLPAQVDVIQDRIHIDSDDQSRLNEALETAFLHGKGNVKIFRLDLLDQPKSFNNTWSPLREPTSSLFSFNNPLGACPACRGFGRVIGIDLEKSVPDETLSIKEGCIKPFQGERGEECQRDLLRFAKQNGIDVKAAWQDLTDDEKEWIYYGERKDTEAAWNAGEWYGVKGFFDWLETKLYKMHVRIFLARYRSYTTCPTCRGTRLQPEALNFKVGGKTLPQLWQLSISELSHFFSEYEARVSNPSSTTRVAKAKDTTLDLILTEITNRLHYLEQVGLSYLTLDRPTRSLSGGEVERVNLTSCLGASLSDTLFVLDEPTVGLHQRDIHNLISVMHALRDKGNTIVVVEHEESVMHAADHLLDIGPNAGELGGEIVFQGSLNETPNNILSPRGLNRSNKTATKETESSGSRSLTLPYLNGDRTIPIPKERRKPTRHLSLKGAKAHNIKNLDTEIPLDVLLCITGVSGSGKSTLTHAVLYEHLAKKFGKPQGEEIGTLRSLNGDDHLSDVLLVDQTPISRTPRSTPAVFIGAFEPIRQLFAQTEEGKAQGLTAGYFSFNSGQGRCERCAGNGYEKVEMQFLSDLFITCPECEGTRYTSEAKTIKYQDQSISDYLSLTISQSLKQTSETLSSAKGKEATLLKKIHQLLQPLEEVGLGYLRLGQALNTLSGGENQRLKLASLLAESKTPARKTETGNPATSTKLLIFDEPTTGLHTSDIERLLQVFHKLVETGHSLIVIEHNIDVIRNADQVIEIGPEAGANGGQIVFQGTPEELAKANTATSPFLESGAWTSRPTSTEPSPPETGNRNTENSAKGGPAITLHGAREHNLKNIDVTIPKNDIVVVTGLSGSGKSTLAFDIVFAEGQRRFLDSMSPYARQFAEQLEKPDIDKINGLPPTVAIEQRISRGGGKSTVSTVTEIYHFLRLLYAKLGIQHCPQSKVPVVSQTTSAIVDQIRKELKKTGGKNVKIMAPVIRGRKGFHTDVAKAALKKGYKELLVDGQFKNTEGFQRLERFNEHDIDIVIWSAADNTRPSIPELTQTVETALKTGQGTIRLLAADRTFRVMSTARVSPVTGRSFEPLDPAHFSFNSPRGWCKTCRGYGSIPAGKFKKSDRFDTELEEELDTERKMDKAEKEELITCPTCEGARINEVARAVGLNLPTLTAAKRRNLLTADPTLGTKIITLPEISQLPVTHAAKLLEETKFKDRDALIARDILPEITQRLHFLDEVGLGYLSLDRSANTLSGGEAQRIRLAAQLGSNLRGVLYVLDEPTIGLHPRDNVKLLDTLEVLRDQGNSLLIVEHDEETMSRAGQIIDLGPGAGINGGRITWQGNLRGGETSKASLNPESSTYRILTETLNHPLSGKRRPIPSKKSPTKWFTVKGCYANNLKEIDVAIPAARLTVITGVSGCGKSSFMRGCLKIAAVTGRRDKPQKLPASDKPYKSATGFKNVEAVYEVDQSPIGKTSRSCPATYVKVFEEIRKVFAQLPDAKLRGFSASRFSFNNSEGQCPDCKGNGRRKLEMDFLPSTWVECESCHEQRYNPGTLEVRYNGKTIGDVLQMSINQAADFFESYPKISRPLTLLRQTGLGYIKLGQPSPTLSGGEAQRLKLVTELTKGVSRSENALLKGNMTAKPNLYLIEEPSIGLHKSDVLKLIDVLHRLVEGGHTVVVIEHNTTIMAEADYIIDIGPEAGAAGGKIVTQGTPEHVTKSKTSRTAPFIEAELG